MFSSLVRLLTLTAFTAHAVLGCAAHHEHRSQEVGLHHSEMVAATTPCRCSHRLHVRMIGKTAEGDARLFNADPCDQNSGHEDSEHPGCCCHPGCQWFQTSTVSMRTLVADSWMIWSESTTGQPRGIRFSSQWGPPSTLPRFKTAHSRCVESHSWQV